MLGQTPAYIGFPRPHESAEHKLYWAHLKHLPGQLPAEKLQLSLERAQVHLRIPDPLRGHRLLQEHLQPAPGPDPLSLGLEHQAGRGGVVDGVKNGTNTGQLPLPHGQCPHLGPHAQGRAVQQHFTGLPGAKAGAAHLVIALGL